ncbi:transposase [Enterococcus ratti]|uniref:transposase n=1 Tax=Enterococcus ratti TaxID=150033 RepID=UPI003513CB32
MNEFLRIVQMPKHIQMVVDFLSYGSNGAIEGTNNKIKVIKRVVYSYRNFHNFQERIYLIQGLIFHVKQKPVKYYA